MKPALTDLYDITITEFASLNPLSVDGSERVGCRNGDQAVRGVVFDLEVRIPNPGTRQRNIGVRSASRGDGKRVEREASAKQAYAYRAKFGRTKAERSAEEKRASQAKEHLDQHRIEGEEQP